MKTPNSKTKKKTAAGSAGSIAAAIDEATLEPPRTKEALNDLSITTARLSIERDAAQIKLDRRVLDLQEAHTPMIEIMTSEIDLGVTLMRLWAVEHRQEEFGEKQEITVAGGDLGFRKGTGKVLADTDEESVVQQLQALPESFAKEKKTLVREKPVLNKQAVLAMAKTEEGAAFLKRIGLRVVVEEEFKFTPARDALPALPVSGGKSMVREMPAASAA